MKVELNPFHGRHPWTRRLPILRTLVIGGGLLQSLDYELDILTQFAFRFIEMLFDLFRGRYHLTHNVPYWSWRVFLRITCIPIDAAFTQWKWTGFLPPLHWPWNMVQWIARRRIDTVISITFITIAIVSFSNLFAIIVLTAPALRNHIVANIEMTDFCPFFPTNQVFSDYDLYSFVDWLDIDDLLVDLANDFTAESIGYLSQVDAVTIAVNMAYVSLGGDSLLHNEWDLRFWDFIDSMKWDEIWIFEYALRPRNGMTIDGPLYLAVTKHVIFSDAFYIAISIVALTACFFIHHFWSNRNVLVLFPSRTERALYWVTLMSLWIRGALYDLETEWNDRCYHWNLEVTVNEMHHQMDARSITIDALQKSMVFPTEINGVIESMLFHDVVTEIAADMNMVTMLVTIWGLERSAIIAIGQYLGHHSLHSIQVHYPLGAGGHVKGRFKLMDKRAIHGPGADQHLICALWNSTRFIRLVVVYRPDIEEIKLPDFYRANGSSLELDMASRQLVIPDHVVQ